MELAVVDGDLDVDDRISREHAFDERTLHALVDRRDEVLRDRATFDLVHELVAPALR